MHYAGYGLFTLLLALMGEVGGGGGGGLATSLKIRNEAQLTY